MNNIDASPGGSVNTMETDNDSVNKSSCDHKLPV